MNASTQIRIAVLACFFTNLYADVVLYSSSFSGASCANLTGQAVMTSGATATQHTLYGTNASATWSASTAFKADGAFVESGAFDAAANRASATLPFTPKNGHLYQLTMTTSFAQLAPTVAAFHAFGYFETANFTGNINASNGAGGWALTRPGDTTADDQTAHFNETGGAGNRNAAPTTIEDATSPSTPHSMRTSLQARETSSFAILLMALAVKPLPSPMSHKSRLRLPQRPLHTFVASRL